jgi:hypothetical protein
MTSIKKEFELKKAFLCGSPTLLLKRLLPMLSLASACFSTSILEIRDLVARECAQACQNGDPPLLPFSGAMKIAFIIFISDGSLLFRLTTFLHIGTHPHMKPSGRGVLLAVCRVRVLCVCEDPFIIIITPSILLQFSVTQLLLLHVGSSSCGVLSIAAALLL